MKNTNSRSIVSLVAKTNPKSQCKPASSKQVLHYAQAVSAKATNASIADYARRHRLVDLLLIDLPYGYGRKPKNMDHNCSPSKHYPTMTNGALLDLNFKQVCAKDAIVAMWAPASQLELALDVMKANGFKYITNVTWHKVFPSGKSAGCATKSAVVPMQEHLLIGRRGAGIPIPRAGKGASYVARIHGVIVALREAHSKKPEIFHHELARVFSTTKSGNPTNKLELFSRSAVKGWKAWGNQSPGSAPLPSPKPAPLIVKASKGPRGSVAGKPLRKAA
jgi:N6-adenosine-specific RNA methylase IME4